MSDNRVVHVGDLLISTSCSNQDIFDQSVVLVLDYDFAGALGVVLNKTTPYDLSMALPQWESMVCPPHRLFAGGPVSTDGAICLAEVANPDEDPPGWHRLKDNIGLLQLDTPVELARGAYNNLRIFAGYAGWAPGQLTKEIDQGMWVISSARVDEIFTAQPSMLWRRITRRQPGTVAFLSTWTTNPDLN